jgi:hypothetical protein
MKKFIKVIKYVLITAGITGLLMAIYVLKELFYALNRMS